MIIEFRVQNFRSFRDEQVLNFVASNYDKSLPENVISPNLPGLPELRLVKAIALYGPNAGGKSNLLAALNFLRRLVVESAADFKPDQPIPAEPFLLDPDFAKKPTIVDLTFVAENTRYEFAVAATSERVLHERLIAYPTGRSEIWYDRLWDDDAKRYDWSSAQTSSFECDPGIVARTRDNALFLSTAAQWNDLKITPLFRWFNRGLMGLGPNPDWRASPAFTAFMMEFFPSARAAIPRLLKSADFGLAEVEIKNEYRDEAEVGFGELGSGVMRDRNDYSFAQLRNLTFQHEGKDGKRFPMKWGDQSSGTRRYFGLLGIWLSAMAGGEVLCVDELDASLHPLLTTELLRYFLRATGATGERAAAQLLFTTHSPVLLDTTLLRRDQIWFADKNREGASFIYPLTEYKPRVDESLARGYLSGRYGAVPFIPRGLVEGDAQGSDVNPPSEAPAHAG